MFEYQSKVEDKTVSVSADFILIRQVSSTRRASLLTLLCTFYRRYFVNLSMAQTLRVKIFGISTQNVKKGQSFL